MRTVLDMEPSRDCLYTTHRSEPIMAEAIAQIFKRFYHEQQIPGSGRLRALDVLHEYLSHDLLSKGEAGEVVARFLCTEAYYQAVEQENRNENNPGAQVVYSSGCSLSSFIGALFHTKGVKTISRIQAQNGGNEQRTFEEVFKDASVRFLQTIRMGDNALNPLVLFGAFLRGEILAVYHSQKKIDVVIPVLMDKKRLTPDNITALGISVKQRDDSVSPDAFEADDIFFGPSQYRPYIMVIMELGQNYNQSKSSDRSQHVMGKPGSKSPTTKEEPPARFGFRVVGCCSEVFGVISSEEDHLYAMILRDKPDDVRKPVEEDSLPHRAAKRYHEGHTESTRLGLTEEEYETAKDQRKLKNPKKGPKTER
ncbi:hypothetical protein BD309DRAFT_932756 [Dichomitus squalens]|uniref:Uncharacterized protein n=2 Tax=Dichomitus squalens TaxID=114155 RepID=A0A4Q9PAS0_9APHY|nr:uncharacterized protein DICSQDRAFT_59308 [Dichomitus squalens LYAD-421 SS1]EJF61971.1 hypothetical protein DICSQDRAFT_59308 [Dichomitus squalens LYAD-421 SS1]TBU21788.1 hypothetical protein BD311DRAFT_827712 [Dichomitus squalens]TBU37187.1 hypothetical protein BD309DRAFT_932756 [Dichomitus squalens]TBU51790.1 hypothetical protein BD310DRAFT_1003500 [Dichomitus squalens]